MNMLLNLKVNTSRRFKQGIIMNIYVTNFLSLLYLILITNLIAYYQQDITRIII